MSSLSDPTLAALCPLAAVILAASLLQLARAPSLLRRAEARVKTRRRANG